MHLIFLLRKFTRQLYKVRGLSRVADLIRKAYLHSPRHFLIEDFDGGLFFNCALNEHISSQVFWRGYYSFDQLSLLRQLLKPDMVFLDAGANKGEFTVFVANYLSEGKVIAFEPVPALWKELEANVKANHFRQVEIVRKALGNANKQVLLFNAEQKKKKELNLGMYSLYPRKELQDPAGTVEIIRLDDYLNAREISRIDIIKIDIEGGELEMLQGAVETIRRFKPVIFIEISFITCRAAGYEPAVILDWLQGFGYRFALIKKNGRTRPIEVKDLRKFQNVLCLPATSGQ